MWLLFTVLLTCTASLTAQAPTDEKKDAPADEAGKDKPGESTGPARFWQAKLKGGHYIVALDHIASVSRHKYLLDGALVIDEVTIDSVGQSLARFYFISPVSSESSSTAVKSATDRATELLEKGSERIGSDISSMVVKKYPETTHARTIEYRLMEEKDLTSLFNSARNAWETGRGRIFTSK
jgi:hypothetical protein